MAAAKGEMLQAGELEVVGFLPAHAMRVQVTPCGSLPSSTVTV